MQLLSSLFGELLSNVVALRVNDDAFLVDIISKALIVVNFVGASRVVNYVYCTYLI